MLELIRSDIRLSIAVIVALWLFIITVIMGGSGKMK